MSSDSVLVKAEEGFTTITMNRPERRNAMSLGLLRDMTAAFRSRGRQQRTRRDPRRERSGLLRRPRLP